MALSRKEIEATILANRTKDIDNLEKYISPRLKDIMDYNKLKDIDIATDLLIKHINNNSHIMLCMDKDQDGIGACSIMYIFLTEVLKHKNVSYNINERADGNGVNDRNVEQILEVHKNRKVDLITFGDHGKLY
jgi:single-stranded DNA-specific DHH superfamily exonuclease